MSLWTSFTLRSYMLSWIGNGGLKFLSASTTYAISTSVPLFGEPLPSHGMKFNLNCQACAYLDVGHIHKVKVASRKKIQDDKTMLGKLVEHTGHPIYRILTVDNGVIRSSNVCFKRIRLFRKAEPLYLLRDFKDDRGFRSNDQPLPSE